ncbi:MAG: ABC transporter permease [Planctomycetes bacterium]|nr:ABC transporter permease [Planctomycetota bacterium]
MSFIEGVWIALRAIRANLLRSFLTLLGIIIGITAIISVIAVINGLNLYVAENLSNFGPNVYVITKFGIISNHEKFLDALRRNRDLHVEDARAIAQSCDLAERVAVEVHSTQDLKRGSDEVKDVDIGGIDPAIVEIEPYDVDQGRNITEDENARAAHVCFIGQDIVANLFGTVDPIGKQMRVRNQEYEVVGTAKKKGAVFGFSRDNFVKVPFNTFRKQFGAHRSVNISVKAAAGASMEESMDQARVVLRSRHHLRYGDDDDFGIVSSEGINDLWESLTRTIFIVAVFVVGISLVVGGIVIMNIMLVSVIERTREIGVRKAIGARNRDIRLQFLIESVTLSCVGGAIGVSAAFTLSWMIRHFTPLPASFPLWAPLLAFGICAIIGVFFGVHPARKAARLNPIEALRSE